jgi:hypothetical protein
MAFLLTGLLGPLIGSLFNHGGSSGSLEGALAQMQTSTENDQISSIMTNTALSKRSTKMTNLVDTQNEATQETAMYDEYLLAVQGAQQHIIQKQEKLVDDSTSG